MRGSSNGRYSKEFRSEAVKMVVEGGVSADEASRQLSLPKSTLENWVRAHKAGKLGDMSTDSISLSETLKMLFFSEGEVAKRILRVFDGRKGSPAGGADPGRSDVSSSRWGRLPVLRALLPILVLLVLVQTFSGVIGLLSFSRLHLDSLLSRHEAIGFDLQRSLERALRFGKPLDALYGIDETLQGAAAVDIDLDNVTVNDPEGRVLYSLRPAAVGSVTHGLSHWRGGEGEENARPSRYLERDRRHHLLIPVHDRHGAVEGLLDLSFRDETMARKSVRIVTASLSHLWFTTLIAGAVLVVTLRLIRSVRRLRKRAVITAVLFLVLGGAQLIHIRANVALFRDSLTDITREKVSTVARMVGKDVEMYLALGIPLESLAGIEDQLQRTLAVTSEIAVLRICDRQSKELYVVGTLSEGGEEEEEDALVIPLGTADGIQGHLIAEISPRGIAAKSREVAFDSLTVLVLSFLFLLELLVFLVRPLLKQLAPSESVRADIASRIRPATFLFMFSSALCCSFIPLHAESLYRPVAGLSRDFVLGLPVSAEMLFGGLALIPVGTWIDRRGWHEPFLLGVVLCSAGTFLSAMATDPVGLIFCRAFTGLGYGFVWMASQGYVLLNTKGKNRARGIAGVVAGIFSGIICGSSAGALLAARIGYRGVFIVSGGAMLLCLLFTIFFLRRFFVQPEGQGRGSFSLGELRRFVLDRDILLVLGCSLLPYSVAMVGLLYFISPLYLGRMGISQGDIGRAIMIFGLCMICIAPLAARFADALADKRILVTAGGMLGGSSLLVFHFLEGYRAVLLAIFLLGVSVAVSAASRNVLTIELPASRRIGMSGTMGVYRSADKMGQTLGPLLIGFLLLFFDIPKAMTLLGSAWIALTVLFVAASRQSRPLPQGADG